jgi:hypothetical protein
MRIFAQRKEQMNSAIQSSGDSGSVAEEVLFKFQDLEITRNTLVIRFFEEKTVIPLKEIMAYHLKWYLHDPTFAKKYWFLVLTVDLKNGEEKSGPIAVAKFNYVNDEHELRQHIQSNIVHAIELAFSRRRGIPRKANRRRQSSASVTSRPAVKVKP